MQKNISIEQNLAIKADKFFKNYGMSLDDGINFLLNQVIIDKNIFIPKNFDIELLKQNDPDMKIIKDTRGEETVSLDEFLKA